ncbi:hypothetical protein LSH36_1558g00037 [Paralvinella palmiformis]|uniref:Fucosyltransferase n=1 Tax=Paralvinella palmiformis TaxID=53620 RepID=A0AAD9IS81_9ANNE|nr:hypothetical protein LSH36_1558g00037 [Paralvinella palmiformis]
MFVRRLSKRVLYVAGFLLFCVSVVSLDCHFWTLCLCNESHSLFCLNYTKDTHSSSKRHAKDDIVASSKVREGQENGKSSTNSRNIAVTRTDDSHSLPSNGTSSKRKLILFWTPKLEADDWTWGLGSDPFRACEYSQCEFTKDKSRVDEAVMLLFYCREEPHFPVVRHSHQLYAHFSREPPYQVKDDYSMYSAAINMTISYRRDGNLHLPYFEMAKYEDRRDPYRPRIAFSRKSKDVVWMTSNCQPESKRNLYADELRKHIGIDVYGRCGNFSCKLGTGGNIYEPCFSRFEEQYKFYLSFENAICRDYFTEKLSNPMNSELVPIVLGGADYDLELPKHSFINVGDFRSPKHLARFLSSMSEKEYYKYFEWKSEYFVRNPSIQCKLCEFLHRSAYARGEKVHPPYVNNYTAWMYDSCDNSFVDSMKSKW